MAITSIEWTDISWNPVRGCTMVSEGCRNCYAMRMAHRFSGSGQAYEGLTVNTGEGPKWSNKITLANDKLTDPFNWRKPSRVFVNSMSDLFHPGVPFEFIDEVFAVMDLCRLHTFQVLTKRPDRMAEYCTATDLAQRIINLQKTISLKNNIDLNKRKVGISIPLANVWLGTSVEDRKALSRIEQLRGIPAAIRFLSCEPLLGELGKLNLDGIRWVIVGGESGPGSRPMNISWVHSIREQCLASKVPFFFKQFGDFGPDESESKMIRVGKKAAGRILSGRTWDEMPALSESVKD